MKILNFVKSLLPSLEKRDVLEDIRITISDLENNHLPSYNSASDFFSSNQPKSKDIINLSKEFYKHLTPNGISKQKSMVGDIYIRLTKYLDILKYLQDEIAEKMEADILDDSLTAKRANLLKASSISFFITRYAGELLNYIYSAEEDNLSKDDATLPPKTIEYINKNLRHFTYLLSDYGISLDEYKKLTSKIPDVTVNSDTADSVASVYNESDLDPITSGIRNFTYNPIYHIRLSIAQWQVSRYKEAKDKKKVLELRLLHLKMLQDGHEDAKLQTEIDYNQSRVDKLNKKISEIEAELE